MVSGIAVWASMRYIKEIFPPVNNTGEIWLLSITALCAFLFAFGIVGVFLRGAFDRDSGRAPHDNETWDWSMFLASPVVMGAVLAILHGLNLIEFWPI